MIEAALNWMVVTIIAACMVAVLASAALGLVLIVCLMRDVLSEAP